MDAKKQALIDEVVGREWDFFQQVNNEGGRADCQDNWSTFRVMRSSQYSYWPEPLIECVLSDLQKAEAEGRNPVMEKYARMMASTAPEQYRKLEPYLPAVDGECRMLTEQILNIHKRWMAEHAEKYPHLSARGRLLYTSQDTEWETSAETYFRGELLTWSKETLRAYLAFVQDCERQGVNLVVEQDRHMVKAYGYASVEEAEAAHAPS